MINGTTLEEILKNHKHWINEDIESWKDMKANLRGADLRVADLYGADLRVADLRGADLDEKELTRKGIKLKEPMIGYKKCQDNKIVTLEIPKGSIIFSVNNGKCRTDRCKVVSIEGGAEAYGFYNNFKYTVGLEIEIFDFCLEYNIECAEGIHFFRTREEAEEYVY